MPGYRKPYRKRAPLRKRPYRKRKTTKSVVAIVKRTLAKSLEKKVAEPLFSPVNTALPFAATSNSGSGAGWEALDINPDIPQNVSSTGRIGNRVNITSGFIQVQLTGQSGQFSATKYKVLIVRKKQSSTFESPTTVVNNLLVPNVFTNFRDANSGLNVNMLTNYEIISSRTGMLPAAQTVMVNNPVINTSAVGTRNLNIGFKFKKPIVQRYDGDSQLDTTENALYMIFLAGNNSDTTRLTGMQAKFYAQMYYTDA